MRVRIVQRIALGLISLATFMLGMSWMVGYLSWTEMGPYLVPTLLLQVVMVVGVRLGVKARLAAMLDMAGDLRVLADGLKLVVAESFQSRKLVGLQGQFRGGSAKALDNLARLAKLVERREDLVLTGFLFWLAGGTQLVWAAESWREKHGAQLVVWLDAWAEFEAMSAVACYAWEHGENSYPQFVLGSSRLELSKVRHPLLAPEIAVDNNIKLDTLRPFYVISGSNMAGKSTLLRAIGLNVVLAWVGAPVCAARASMSAFHLALSVGIQDALAEGRSKFLAEVERLSEAISAAREGGPVLFLIDEILSGTNSEDRRVAAGAIVRTLVAAGAVGVISTHDLALTNLANEVTPMGQNMRMESEDASQPLAFDYRLKPGVVQQRNGLAIARMVGIEVNR